MPVCNGACVHMLVCMLFVNMSVFMQFVFASTDQRLALVGVVLMRNERRGERWGEEEGGIQRTGGLQETDGEHGRKGGR